MYTYVIVYVPYIIVVYSQLFGVVDSTHVELVESYFLSVRDTLISLVLCTEVI